MLEMKIPAQVQEVLDKLAEHYYSAFIVGKCVRETALGNSVMDYDVITNAAPERLIQIFRSYPTIDTNISRGELIVKVLGMAILVTPYISGYDKNGSPYYTNDIVADLMRRDFSMNAIAYSPTDGFADPFHGVNCLNEGSITVRAIGEEQLLTLPNEKYTAPKKEEITSAFRRDPTTILRAIGYYATGDYVISEATRAAIFANIPLLSEIPREKLKTEIAWILNGRRASVALDEYTDVIAAIIPEIEPLIGFDAHSTEHCFDLWRHSVKSVGYASPLLSLRFAMLFHDLGKPDCFSLDTRGNGHYYGYEERSVIIASRIMRRLGFTEKDIAEISFLILNQQAPLGDDRRSVKLSLQTYSPEKLKLLLQFRYADVKAKAPYLEEYAALQKKLVDTVNEITAFHECYSLETLAISRRDLLQRGITKTDEETTELLTKLLNFVLDAPTYNTPNRLLDMASKDVKARQYTMK